MHILKHLIVIDARKPSRARRVPTAKSFRFLPDGGLIPLCFHKALGSLPCAHTRRFHASRGRRFVAAAAARSWEPIRWPWLSHCPSEGTSIPVVSQLNLPICSKRELLTRYATGKISTFNHHTSSLNMASFQNGMDSSADPSLPCLTV